MAKYEYKYKAISTPMEYNEVNDIAAPGPDWVCISSTVVSPEDSYFPRLMTVLVTIWQLAVRVEDEGGA